MDRRALQYLDIAAQADPGQTLTEFVRIKVRRTSLAVAGILRCARASASASHAGNIVIQDIMCHCRCAWLMH